MIGEWFYTECGKYKMRFIIHFDSDFNTVEIEKLNNMNENQTTMSSTDATTSASTNTIGYSYIYPTVSDYEIRKDAVIQAVNATYLMKGATNNPIEEKDFMKTVETIYKFLSKSKNS